MPTVLSELQIVFPPSNIKHCAAHKALCLGWDGAERNKMAAFIVQRLPLFLLLLAISLDAPDIAQVPMDNFVEKRRLWL